MFGSETLDVAIGLIFLFLLLSLVCSSAKEAIETVLKYRAKDLQRGIREMLGDSTNTGLVAEFYRHPLISGLFRGQYDPNNLSNLPSYIPPKTFAIAILDIARRKSRQAGGTPGAAEQPTTGQAEAHAAEAFAPRTVAELRTTISTSENQAIKGALLPLIDAAGNDIERARENIEHWYNAAMDRVAGWYKRRTQVIIACVGLALATIMNVDAIGIARYLNTSQTARAVLVAHIQATRNVTGPTASELLDPMGFLERQGGLPLGWIFKPQEGQTDVDFQRDWRRAPYTFGGWFLKVAGIVFTTFAITLGAPFWFDILNKFMVVRSTVKPQEKSPSEKSKD